MKTAYILIDFENVQPAKIGAFGAGTFKIKVFVGSRQSRVSVSLAEALQPLGKSAEYVQIEGSGRNALDLHIAYYIGRLSVQEPDSVFHVISKDTDYDPLIAHLKKLKIVCHRWSAITDIANGRQATAKAATKAAPKPALSAPDRIEEVIDNLSRRKRALPATVKTLTSTIKSLYRDATTGAEVDGIIEKLERRGLITVKDGKVSYRLTKIAT